MPTAPAHALKPRLDHTASGDGIVQVDALPLYHGDRLAPVAIAWRLAGPPGAPIVAALGGISADRSACSWWPALVGPGRPLDTTRFRVLGIDYLGGSGATTGPQPGQQFPAIDSHDQAAALLAVCDRLGIGRLHAVAGASYGGMVGLVLAQQAPERIGHVLAIGAAHCSNALATAWRAVQREIVRHALGLGDGTGGLRLARALAMTTYRTRAEFSARFPVQARQDGGRALFPVEEYLFARAEDYTRRHTPESFLCLSQSIDLHRADPARIRVPVTLVAFAEDQLVTLDEARELACRLAGPCELIELHSHFGHDAFLKEPDLLAPAFAAALDGAYA